MKEEKQRTINQNKSLHKYCTDLAEEFNLAGFDQRIVLAELKAGFEVPWTTYSVKDLFRLIGKTMYGKESTKELTTVEMQNVYEVFDKRMSEISGIHVEWPSKEKLMMEQMFK